MQTAEKYTAFIDMHRVDMEVVDRTWAGASARVESVPPPLLVLPGQPEAPIELLGIEIEAEETVESGRCHENTAVFANDLVAVFEVTVAERLLAVEVPVIAKKLITGSDVDIVTVEGDSSQASVGTTALKIDTTGIPVNDLPASTTLKVDDVNTTMAFALLASANNGCRNELREL